MKREEVVAGVQPGSFTAKKDSTKQCALGLEAVRQWLVCLWRVAHRNVRSDFTSSACLETLCRWLFQRSRSARLTCQRPSRSFSAETRCVRMSLKIVAGWHPKILTASVVLSVSVIPLAPFLCSSYSYTDKILVPSQHNIQSLILLFL